MLKVVARVRDASGESHTQSISNKNNGLFTQNQIDRMVLNTMNMAKDGVVTISYSITPIDGDTFKTLGRVSKISGKTMLRPNAALEDVVRVYNTMIAEINSQLRHTWL